VQSDFAIQLPQLDDDQILATDESGKELLHFALSWAGKTVCIRYPRFGEWQQFCADVLQILTLINGSIGKLDIDSALAKRDTWQDLAGRMLYLHDVWPMIQKVFFRYLDPMVDELNTEQSKHWIESHAPLDGIVRMLVALLMPQSQLKKNVRFALTQLFPALRDQHSMPSPMNSGAGPKNEPTEVAFSPYASFC